MIVKNVTGNTYDVFWNDGWNNWARIQNRNGFIKAVGGLEIPKIVFAMLIKEFQNK